MADFVVTDFGALADGIANDAAAIQTAIDQCTLAGGGRVIVPAGRTVLSGAIQLKSNVELHIERGGTLLASPQGEDFRIIVGQLAHRAAFIVAEGASNIGITGFGVIDGNGRAYVAENLPHIYVMKDGRPKTFLLLGCKHVTFRDITIRDGANWTVRFSGCEDVVIHAIRLFNDLKLPNGDAIGLDRCRNVRISDCHIESGDDCIVLKALEETAGYGPCENITVRGCTLVSTSAAWHVGRPGEVGCGRYASLSEPVAKQETLFMSERNRQLTKRLVSVVVAVGLSMLAFQACALAEPPATQPAPPPYAYQPNVTVAAPEGVPATIFSPLGKSMSLKFDDEFNAVIDKDGQPYVDRSKWQTTFWQGSSQRTLWANGEAQYYMDKDYGGRGEVPRDEWFNPFSFEEPGVLTISATKVPEKYWHNWWMGKERCFSSGLLISDKKFSFQYGYMEGRFKLPGVRGAWPAFWILGDDPSRGKPDDAHAWGPEVDAFEFFGHRPTKHSAGIIGAKKEKLTGWHFGYNEVSFDISEDYHTWGFEWDDKKCVWTFDGKQWATCDTPASMNRPMYLLVNLAVGGNWYMQEMKANKTPFHQWEVDEEKMPWKMKCDWVRVYQADESPASPPADAAEK